MSSEVVFREFRSHDLACGEIFDAFRGGSAGCTAVPSAVCVRGRVTRKTRSAQGGAGKRSREAGLAMVRYIDAGVTGFSGQPMELEAADEHGPWHHVPDIFARRSDGSALLLA
jgi:hypothetical protein